MYRVTAENTENGTTQVYEYRKMIKDETHNDILAQKSLDFMQDLIVKRAQEIKREVFEE
jgi:hypothetical protein